MYSTPTPPPPVPPPKPNSRDASRLGTPSTNSPRPPPETARNGGVESMGGNPNSRLPPPPTTTDTSGLIPAPTAAPRQQAEPIPDPGDRWLPKILEDKSKQDLAEILSNPSTLQALCFSPRTMHPSLSQTQDALTGCLQENLALAQHLTELESRLGHQRATTQAQLLSAHALERQWRAKEVDMDTALAPFAPAALYATLTAALQEQEMLCAAMEESFLEGQGGGNGSGGGGEGVEGSLATERETLDWVRRYREARRLYYLRQERKERWNERRVGGWR